MRQAEIDSVAVIVAGIAEFEADRRFPDDAFDRKAPLPYCAADRFRAGPERRGQAAFERERSGDPPLRDVGEQS